MNKRKFYFSTLEQISRYHPKRLKMYFLVYRKEQQKFKYPLFVVRRLKIHGRRDIMGLKFKLKISK